MSDFHWSLRRFPHIIHNHPASTHVTLYKTEQNTVVLSALRQHLQDALKLSCRHEILLVKCTLYEPVLRHHVCEQLYFDVPTTRLAFLPNAPERFNSVCQQSRERSPEKEEVPSGGRNLIRNDVLSCNKLNF
jgi:hypothetical protein